MNWEWLFGCVPYFIVGMLVAVVLVGYIEHRIGGSSG